jgi:hypothetical protein
MVRGEPITWARDEKSPRDTPTVIMQALQSLYGLRPPSSRLLELQHELDRG